MSGLIGDLIGASQSLAAQQLGVTVAGKNLANANNPAYARQRVDLSAVGPGGTLNMGVVATGTQQIRSQFLDTQVMNEASQTGFLQAQSDNLTQAQTDLNEQIDSSSSATSITGTGNGSTGISAALNDFFSAFSNLSANPTDAGAKQVLLEKAGFLASQFNVTDSRLQTLQGNITSEVNSDVSTVNGLLGDIANLNGQISKIETNAPGSALDLRDQRQADLEQLAQYMNFTATELPNSNGQIQIAAKDASNNDVVLVNKTTVTGNGVTFDGTQFSGGSPATTLALQGGSLAGDVAVRDGAIQQLRDNLKTTASQLTAAVNAAYNPTSATGNFFQNAPASGIIALDPSLNSSTLKTTDTGNAGANELALAVSQVADKNFSTSGGDLIDGTIGGFYAQTVSGFGGAVADAQTQLGDQQTVQQMLTNQRNSVSGVSQDEELTSLMQYQRAFQASSRVVNVLDNLLDVVVNGLMK